MMSQYIISLLSIWVIWNAMNYSLGTIIRSLTALHPFLINHFGDLTCQNFLDKNLHLRLIKENVPSIILYSPWKDRILSQNWNLIQNKDLEVDFVRIKFEQIPKLRIKSFQKCIIIRQQPDEYRLWWTANLCLAKLGPVMQLWKLYRRLLNILVAPLILLCGRCGLKSTCSGEPNCSASIIKIIYGLVDVLIYISNTKKKKKNTLNLFSLLTSETKGSNKLPSQNLVFSFSKLRFLLYKLSQHLQYL